MLRPIVRRAYASLVIAAAACGGGSPAQPGSTTGTEAAIAVTASPSPAALRACDPPECTTPGYEIAVSLTLRESAGVSGRVDSVTFTLTRDSDRAVLVTGTIAPPSVQVPFAANGSSTLPFSMHAARADVTGPATMTLVVNATDAGGRAISASVAVPVSGPPAS